MNEPLYETSKPQFRIGAVSRLTNIPTDTLRMWERRYNVVEPRRADGGNRLYTQDDINRLTLIKRLVESGHAIGTVANLSQADLVDRMSMVRGGRVERQEGTECRLAVMGENLGPRVAELGEETPGVDVVGIFSNLSELEETVGDLRATIVLLEYPTLHEGVVRDVRHLLRRLNSAECLVVYGFGNRTSLRMLTQIGVTLLKSPIEISEIKNLCGLGTRNEAHEWDADVDLLEPTSEPVPRALFSRKQLATFASVSTAVKCECPHHLADLILSLDAFESYSMECENRNDEDAALHAYLHAATAKARSIMERALQRVAQSEGIKV